MSLRDQRELAWQERAACRGADPELFFPSGKGWAFRGQIADARAICAGCPVRDACARYSIEAGESSGIWAGLTEWERESLLRRRLGPVAAGTGRLSQGGPAAAARRAAARVGLAADFGGVA